MAPCPTGSTKADGIGVWLVTSRRTGRWVIPKGHPIAGLTPPESAAREAYEKAGIEGETGTEGIGDYRYTKLLRIGLARRARVIVFPLLVTRMLKTWPEQYQRRRQWFAPPAAAYAVEALASGG
jgi:uncharacterized protein